MAYPRLTFFCELEPSPLLELFTDALISDLAELEAGVSLAILDFSDERLQVVQRLNEKQIPVVAWLLLPKEQGYWFNASNSSAALTRYHEFKSWTAENRLVWDGIGLDIEPALQDFEDLASDGWRFLPRVVGRLFTGKRLKTAESDYQALIDDARSEGYRVESYQIPLIDDERKAGSSFLRKVGGIVDVDVDREVWMLYTSFLRPKRERRDGGDPGVGVLWSYAPDAQAIGIGSTGGGVESSFGPLPTLGWEELDRDLRLSWYWCNQLYVFSLEGCVEQGFMPRLKNLAWDKPIVFPEELTAKVNTWRGGLQTFLWLTAHVWQLLLGIAGLALIGWNIKRYIQKGFKNVY